MITGSQSLVVCNAKKRRKKIEDGMNNPGCCPEMQSRPRKGRRESLVSMDNRGSKRWMTPRLMQVLEVINSEKERKNTRKKRSSSRLWWRLVLHRQAQHRVLFRRMRVVRSRAC
jgi:hypothetical protein